jgi:CheY-like chemotaxis protein/nitrogen-specific signal transduction histidine kinase
MDNKETILIVDDTAENIDILSNIIKSKYKVKVAINGNIALKAVNSSPKPDLILLDVMMPQMDGYEVCKILKSNPKTKDIPVIFITALDDNISEEKGLNLGAVDYIAKPINPAIVLRRIQTHLALYDQNRALEHKVQEEVAKRMLQQELLVKQSRLAAMGEMMSAITHQWNQPLSSISASNDAIRMQSKIGTINEEDIEKFSGFIKDSVLFMRDTILDFKNYFNTKKIKKTFCVKEQVDAVMKILDIQLKHSNIEVNIEIDGNVNGYGVESEFKHVILNLIANAKDALNEKKAENKKIVINASSIDESYSQLIIKDNAGGIPENIINKIFDDHFTTKEDKGTGIGLFMSKMIIEDEFKGEISVCNEDNGAKFIVKFPSKEIIQ